MTLFEKIIAREIPADIVYEDDLVLAQAQLECYINCYLAVHFAQNLAWPLLDFAVVK